MPSIRLLLVAGCAGMLIAGCSQRRTTPDPFVGRSEQHGAAPSSNSSIGFKQELLISQLRHTELDLQTAKSEEERRHLLERAETIRNQLATLGVNETRTTRKVAHSQNAPPQQTLSGDPFLQAQQRDVNLNVLAQQAEGRTSLSDMQAADAVYASGQAVNYGPQSPIPQTMVDPRQTEANQAASMLFQSQLQRKSLETTDAQRRLRELELELQFTEDTDKQDALAIQIAKLRRQIHRESK